MPNFWIKRGKARRLGLSRLGAPPPVMHSEQAFMNRRLENDAPIVDDANEYATKLKNQLLYSQTSTPVQGFYAKYYNTSIMVDEWSVPIYTMPPNYPRSKVQWYTWSPNGGSGTGPPASDSQTFGLQSKLNSVPVPLDLDPTTLAARNNDGHVVIWSPSSNEFWEFYKFKWTPEKSFHCAYAGYANGANTSWDGTYANTGWGARATSLSLAAGVMLMQEYLDGVFPHMIGFSLPVSEYQVFLPPATRTDGSNHTNARNATTGALDARDAVPAGAVFRFPYDYDVPDTWHPLTQMMVTAIRDYGMVKVDATGGTTNFYVEDPKTVGTPYQSVPADSKPWNSRGDLLPVRKDLFDRVPWNLLQQVEYES